MVDGIHDFTVADSQKNPSEELIVSWIAVASRGEGGTLPIFGYMGAAEGLKSRPCLGQK